MSTMPIAPRAPDFPPNVRLDLLPATLKVAVLSFMDEKPLTKLALTTKSWARQIESRLFEPKFCEAFSTERWKRCPTSKLFAAVCL